MKRLLSILFLSSGISLYSQEVSDLGKATFDQVKLMNSAAPCETTPNKVLTYCVEDGSFMSYTFRNNKLNGIIFLTAFLTKTLAEQDMVNQVKEFSKKTGKTPVYTGGMALFSMTSTIGVTFEVREFQGTFYVSYSTLLND